ncbi:hypothetical protein ACJJTC_017222 [Scirpophaga incertulas]
MKANKFLVKQRAVSSTTASTTTKTSTTTTLSPAIKTTTEDPCLYVPKPLSDFRRPDGRISDVKCQEYIWDIKTRKQQEEEQNKRYECEIRQALLNGTEDDEAFHAIGGRITLPGEFPHMGAIGWKAVEGTWIFKCGGTLISSKFILTAAHCSKASERDNEIADITPKIVRLGDKNIIDSFDPNTGLIPTDVNIIRIINHPDYKAPKKYNDISLFELKEKVSFTDYIQPACLYTGPGNILIGRNATLTGWGVIETVARTRSPELQAAVVDILDSKKCDELLKPSCNRHWCGMTDSQVCAGKLSGGVDACQGDSGGPLQMKIPTITGQVYHVVGVISFGKGCALPDLPGLYTRVSSFLDWIENIVWKS